MSEKNIDKDIYNSMIQNISIKNIVLKNLEISDVNYVEDDNADIHLNLNYSCNESTQKNNLLEFYPKFKINLSYQEKDLVTIKFTMAILYELNTKESYRDEYIEEFINRNVPINIWPYARELISSIGNRIGYPVLLIAPYVG